MQHYKISENGTVIGIGHMFLRWSEKHRNMLTCEAGVAQLVQSDIDRRVFHAAWMKPVPETALAFDEAEVAIISEMEFDELRLLLESGESVPEEDHDQTAPPFEQHEQDTQEEDKPMTVRQMRESIQELQKANRELLALLRGDVK